MNKVIILGNGFDLAHGLKTRYSDFILWYLNKVFTQINSQFLYQDDLIKLSRQGAIMPIAEFKYINDFIRTYNNEYTPITIEFKHSFFQKLIMSNADFNWVDIESMYYEELKKLYSSTSPNTKKELKDLNKCFDLIKKELIEHLKQVDNTQWNEDINSHLQKTINETIARNKNTLADESRILILNFNYTSTIEMYLKDPKLANLVSINYIHGNLKNEEKNPIIFGYGDEMDSHYEKIEQLNDNEFLSNFKSFWYLKTNNYRSLQSFLNSGSILNNSFEVHVMGHSCGLSDRVLLNSIFEHSKCQSIKIYYYEKSKVDNDFFEKTQEISRHFKHSSKGRMRTIIVPFEESVPLTKHKG
ncbi:MAG: AbiH family protein [Bacteroidia bacterium]